MFAAALINETQFVEAHMEDREKNVKASLNKGVTYLLTYFCVI